MYTGVKLHMLKKIKFNITFKLMNLFDLCGKCSSFILPSVRAAGTGCRRLSYMTCVSLASKCPNVTSTWLSITFRQLILKPSALPRSASCSVVYSHSLVVGPGYCKQISHQVEALIYVSEFLTIFPFLAKT